MLTNEFHQQCESIAVRTRHELGLRGYDPLPARCLADHLEIMVVCPEELPEMDEETIARAVDSSQWSAIAVLTQPPTIIYHPQQPIFEQEFSVMH